MSSYWSVYKRVNPASSFLFCIAQEVRQRIRSTRVQSFGDPLQDHGRFLPQPARQRHSIFSPHRPLCPPTNAAMQQDEKDDRMTGWGMD
jgi:hypothetical protein